MTDVSNPVKSRTKSEETRARILQAAQEMFHERGFEATTMREIADRAEVATGAAYYYFDSKNAIVMAFYDQARKDMRPLLEQALEETEDLRERLRRLIQIKLDYFGPSRGLLRALSGRTSPEDPLSPFSEQTREIRENDIRLFERALEGSRTPGPQDLRQHLPRLLWMYQMGIILYWISDASKRQAKTEALLDQSLDLITRLIRLAGLPLTRPIRKRVIQLMDTLMA
jgi:AcrR family transcriptional regulator